MSFFAWVIYECISPRKGCKALIIFNIIGLISVIYWIITEQFGKGDLRWYGVVQFYPIVAIPIMLVLYKSTFKHWKEVRLIFLLFAIARLSENLMQKYTISLMKSLVAIRLNTCSWLGQDMK